MLRTALVSLGASVLVALSWLRLEEPRADGRRLVLLLAIALASALLPRRRWRLAASVPALLLGAAVAFDSSPGAAFDRAQSGFKDFYDVALPFDPAARPEMHGLVLLAIFAFALAIGLTTAERRAIAASAALVAGAAWPATLHPGEGALARGAVILAAALAVLFAVRVRPLARRAPALVAGAAVILAAVLASSFPAVARDQMVGWETWDPYDRNDPRVAVDYVWDSSYEGIEFPESPTKLFEIATSGAPRYWRATTLDLYGGGRWLESLSSTDPVEADSRVELLNDRDLPRAARNDERWLEQQVLVSGLRDTHLVGSSMPTAYAVDDGEGMQFSAGGIAEIDGGLRKGLRYTVWSYSPTPRPSQLARASVRYSPELSGTPYLAVERDVRVPPFASPGRHRRVLDLIRTEPGLGQYEDLYRIARQVGGETNPYGAVVAIETWLRTSPQFIYEEQPERAVPGVAPLVDFVTRTRAGYCQHFAGAMTLMLRYLGIPSRVAAGFTSGTLNDEGDTWTVTDRNAHTWVEVWFRGYGWLPFDPTPARGRLGGSYTSASLGFRDREALEALGAATPQVGGEGRRAIEQVSQLLARERAVDRAAALQQRESESDAGSGERTLGMLVLLALAVAAAIAAVKVVRRRLRYLGGDSRRAAAACRQELADFVRDQRVDVGPAATLEELGEAVQRTLAVDTSRFVAAAGEARFGPEAGAAAATRSARRELRKLVRQIRARLSTRRRVRGLVSLRSLRRA
jgi:transglutaminase-like putative cysteine protease